ncbi:protein BCCIP homolog [Halichondria panicea]|uniref:protein BCCIP homolog n=1 Tax=Halichondria panicea TaxID=6063 RepID=UPI00312B673B
MPPKKRLRSLQEPQSEESEQDSSGSDQSDAEQEIHVDFEAFSISEDDFHGIRCLLKQSFAGSSVDVSALTDLIIKQADHIGSSIKVCDDDNADSAGGSPSASGGDDECVFGVTTLVHLNYHKASDCVKQIKELLLTQCKSHADSMLLRLSQILTESVGLVINERLLNIPAEIASPMLNSLLIELKESSQKHPQQFACKYCIVITRSNIQPTVTPRKRHFKKRKDKKQASVESGNSTPTFDYVECEVLQEECLLSFSYPVREDSEATGVKQKHGSSSIEHCRTVLVFEASKFRKAVSNLEEECTKQ